MEDQPMTEERKLYSYRGDKEEAERQGKKQIMRLPGVGEVPISIASRDALHVVSLTGRQALALLRLLEHNRVVLEQEAEKERESEFGHGPGASPAEVPQKIQKGDSRIGKQAISVANKYHRRIEGLVTAILRYRNGVEQIEVTRDVYALDSPKPGTEVTWVHVDDVDIF